MDKEQNLINEYANLQKKKIKLRQELKKADNRQHEIKKEMSELKI